MKIELIKKEYILAHGKEPRGRGYWAFSKPHEMENIFWGEPNQTLGEAARQISSTLGVRTLVVRS